MIRLRQPEFKYQVTNKNEMYFPIDMSTESKFPLTTNI